MIGAVVEDRGGQPRLFGTGAALSLRLPRNVPTETKRLGSWQLALHEICSSSVHLMPFHLSIHIFLWSGSQIMPKMIDCLHLG
jgi:hypothetical protein